MYARHVVVADQVVPILSIIEPHSFTTNHASKTSFGQINNPFRLYAEILPDDTQRRIITVR